MSPIEHQHPEPESVEARDHSVDYAEERAKVAELLSRRGFLRTGALVTGAAITALLMSDAPLVAEDRHMLEQALEQEKDKMWREQQGTYDKYSKLETQMAEKLFTPIEFAELFRGGDMYITCVDERITIQKDGDKVAIAGSTILLEGKEMDEFARKLLASGRKIGSVTYHEGCGACQIFVGRLKESLERIRPEFGPEPKVPEPEEVGRRTAEKLCTKLGMKAGPMRIGFDGKPSHMEGSPKFHDARRVAIDTVGTFNSGHAFEITAAYYPNIDAVVSDLEVCIKIALGNHGMGAERFMKEPFQIVLVQDPRNPRYSMDIKRAIQPLLLKYADTTKLLIITPPKENLPKLPEEKKDAIKPNGAANPHVPMPQSYHVEFNGVNGVMKAVPAEDIATRVKGLRYEFSPEESHEEVAA